MESKATGYSSITERDHEREQERDHEREQERDHGTQPVQERSSYSSSRYTGLVFSTQPALKFLLVH